MNDIRDMERFAKHKDRLRGGLADKKKPSDFSTKQLRMGRKVEREHTGNGALAKEIAMDHLTEDRNYYTKLKKMEKKSAKSLMSFCKKCGKAHVPVCDRCGKKLGQGPDFRSMHGPCDKCAFPEKAKRAMWTAFVDEFTKISEIITVDSEKLRTVAQELAGEASMCWDPPPGKQVFKSDQALRAVDGALARLKEKQSVARVRIRPRPKHWEHPTETNEPGEWRELQTAREHLDKVGGLRSFSSAFRRPKKVEEHEPDDEPELKPNLSFLERHPKAVAGALALATAAGVGGILYKKRDAVKKLLGALRPKPMRPQVPIPKMEKAIEHELRQAKPAATNIAVPATASPKTSPEPVTNLGEQFVKFMKKQHGEAEAPARKLSRRERRYLEQIARQAKLNRRGD